MRIADLALLFAPALGVIPVLQLIHSSAETATALQTNVEWGRDSEGFDKFHAHYKGELLCVICETVRNELQTGGHF